MKRGLFDVGFWALAVWVMVMGQMALVIGDGIYLGCSDNDIHTATTENIIGNWTVINHPLTNGNPNRSLIENNNGHTSFKLIRNRVYIWRVR